MYSLNFILFITGAHSTNSVWLRRRFAVQARTERVSRRLKREPVPAPVIAAAKRARRAVALISEMYLFRLRSVISV